MKKKVPLYNLRLKNLESRLKSFKNKTPEIIKEIIRNNESQIIEALQSQLYDKGVNGYSEELMKRKPYRPSTIKRKQRRGQPYDRVTLKDSGNFYRQMYLVCESDGFYITSRSKVTPMLTKKYGQAIFRLSDPTVTKVILPILRKELVKRLKQTTHA